MRFFKQCSMLIPCDKQWRINLFQPHAYAFYSVRSSNFEPFCGGSQMLSHIFIVNYFIYMFAITCHPLLYLSLDIEYNAIARINNTREFLFRLFIFTNLFGACRRKARNSSYFVRQKGPTACRSRSLI